MIEIEEIRDAFSHRERPSVITIPGHSLTTEYEDADAFQGKAWIDVRCSDLDKHMDAVHGFSPQAFCYFLPGIYCAGIGEQRPDLLVNQALIGMLDRGNSPTSWDDFFSSRWPLLSRKECKASQSWVLWLADAAPSCFSDASLSRAFDTLELLSNSASAVPIASRHFRR